MYEEDELQWQEIEECDEFENAVEPEEPEKARNSNDFVSQLRDLSGCASFKLNFISLDRTGASVIAADADEAFQSRSKCEAAAEQCLVRAIREAERKMEDRMRMSGELSFLQAFNRYFDTQMQLLREQLETLRTDENSAIVDEMAQYMTVSKIHTRARAVCEELSGNYDLPGAGEYRARISYDVWDPSDFETGIAKLIAKGFMRYGFDCYDAIRAVEEDAKRLLDTFQEDFNSRMQDEILAVVVEPVQALLPKFRVSQSLRSA